MFSLITYDIWISIEESYSQKSQFNELKFNNKQRVEFWIAIISVHCRLLRREANGSFSFSCTFNFCRIKVSWCGHIHEYAKKGKRTCWNKWALNLQWLFKYGSKVIYSSVVCTQSWSMKRGILWKMHCLGLGSSTPTSSFRLPCLCFTAAAGLT